MMILTAATATAAAIQRTTSHANLLSVRGAPKLDS